MGFVPNTTRLANCAAMHTRVISRACDWYIEIGSSQAPLGSLTNASSPPVSWTAAPLPYDCFGEFHLGYGRSCDRHTFRPFEPQEVEQLENLRLYICGSTRWPILHTGRLLARLAFKQEGPVVSRACAPYINIAISSVHGLSHTLNDAHAPIGILGQQD